MYPSASFQFVVTIMKLPRSVKTAFAVALLTATSLVAAETDYRLITLAENLNFPWSLAVLPDGRILVAELGGTLRIVDDETVSPPLSGVPDVYRKSQGGLFDVLLHPDFASNQTVYLSYAQGPPGANATRISRAVLNAPENGEAGISEVETLFTVAPTKDTPVHYGGRLAFLPDGTLIMSTGDGFDYREAAQDLTSLLGKIIRINDDGSIPADNPFTADPNIPGAIYSYGHRNPQGLISDPVTGRIYLHEHGPRGGDEVNLIEPGANYGWPMVTHGLDYSGAYVSPYTSLPGLVDPLHVWVPSIAPSGFAIYRGDRFPEWDGDLFVGALVDQDVRRLTMDGDRIVDEHKMFTDLGARVRDIRVHDGELYIITDGPGGRILKVERK
jgi:glucose/arabinose dehydrogenase